LKHFAGCGRERLVEQIAYLKAEYLGLRERLPKRLMLTAREKSHLLAFGAAVKEHLNALVTDCKPEMFLRRLRAAEAAANGTMSAAPERLLGRPRTADETRVLVARIARKTGFGLALGDGVVEIGPGVKAVQQSTGKNHVIVPLQVVGLTVPPYPWVPRVLGS
jgi:putative transposase